MADKNKKIQVSVIIPIYNSEKYLKTCLESVLNQTLENIEVICIDDGSTDGSVSILREYQKRDDRIKVVTLEHRNAGAARNAGIDIAKGEYLSFLDSDDLFEKDMLEDAYHFATDYHSDVVIWRSDSFDQEGHFRSMEWTVREKIVCFNKVTCFRSFKNNRFKAVMGWAWDKLFLRSFVVDNHLRFQEIDSSNDLLFVYTSLLLAKKIYISDKVLTHYRDDNAASISHRREKTWNCFYLAIRSLKKNLIDLGLYELYKRDYLDYAVNFCLWHLRTVNEATRKKIITSFKERWWEELGFDTMTSGEYFNENEYLDFVGIIFGKELNPYQKISYKLRGFLISLNENGFIYTYKRTLYHLGLGEDNDIRRTQNR